SLWNHVSPDTRQLVDRFCAENGLSPDAVARLKPWLAAVNIAALEAQKSGMKFELGMDKYFLERAKDRMQVEQLESAEWQLRLMSDIAERQQERYLAGTLTNAGVGSTVASNLQATWLSGD